MLKRTAFLALLGLAPIACDSGTGPDDDARVSIQFRATSGATASSVVSPVTSPVGSMAALTLNGGNGSLTLDDIRLVVAEFELEYADSTEDCDDAVDESFCEEIELSPQFLQLPLDGSAVPTVTRSVPAGLYDELEFEVEDLELDEENEDGVELQQLYDAILDEFPDWPAEASLLAVGSFTPTGGEAVPFRVFFDAEIEIEIEFPAPGLDLTTASDPAVTVVVDPAQWFTLPDGSVMDLSQFEGQVVEFEAELENGFTEIEFDD